MINLTLKHPFLIGIDSDGCVFDTMEVKHKECFAPNVVKYFGLAGVSKFAREACDFVNLYSKSRGINRFPALIEELDWTAARPEVLARGVKIEIAASVRKWVATEPKPGNPSVAERFEVYACGVELANGFGELTDASEQRRRFTQAMDEKEKRYGERYPLDEDFLAALAFMPEACGVALGFDRLVMLACGASRIDQVVWSPES